MTIHSLVALNVLGMKVMVNSTKRFGKHSLTKEALGLGSSGLPAFQVIVSLPNDLVLGNHMVHLPDA